MEYRNDGIMKQGVLRRWDNGLLVFISVDGRIKNDKLPNNSTFQYSTIPSFHM
jgi:hypothetical protein